MPAVLTTTSVVSCGHPPGAVQTTSTAKLTAGGEPVLIASGVENHDIAGCSNTNAPCTAAGKVTGGAAAKLQVGGAPVLLATLTGQTNATGQLSAEASQGKLTANEAGG